MEQVLLRRAANALLADVEVAGPLGWLLAVPFAWLKRVSGGLWVGGTMTVTAEHVRFEPNAVNVALHENAHAFSVPYRDMRDVRVERGFGTDIIVIATADGERRIRCYKAAAATQAIEAARRAASAQPS